MEIIKIKFKKLDYRAIIPQYQTDGASGFDLHCLEDVIIVPFETTLIRTGLAVEVPKGVELQIRPRGGLSLNSPMLIRNSPGTVDSDYRGEIKIIAYHLGHKPMKHKNGSTKNIVFKAGDRVAQGVVCPVYVCDIEEHDNFVNTERGENGFGSTGI